MMMEPNRHSSRHRVTSQASLSVRHDATSYASLSVRHDVTSLLFLAMIYAVFDQSLLDNP